MKKIFIAFATGLAVAIGFAAWLVWMIAKHRTNVQDADDFLMSDLTTEREKVLKELNIETLNFEDRKKSLVKELEAQTREDIIHAFKKAFHVADDDPDHGEFIGSSGPESPSTP